MGRGWVERPGWVDHSIWWHVYPLGFGGAPIRDADPQHAPRLRRLLNWLDYAVELGASGKSVEDLLARERPESKTSNARTLILDILDDEGAQESDQLDARIASETGLAAKTVKNARTKLKDEGLIKVQPEKDDLGTIVRWNVSRTQAARP